MPKIDLKSLFKWLPVVLQCSQYLEDLLDRTASFQVRSLALLDIIGELTAETDTTVDDEVLALVRGILEREETWATIDALIDIFDGEGEPKVRLACAQEAKLDPATIILIVELGAYILRLIRERRNK